MKWENSVGTKSPAAVAGCAYLYPQRSRYGIRITVLCGIAEQVQEFPLAGGDLRAGLCRPVRRDALRGRQAPRNNMGAPRRIRPSWRTRRRLWRSSRSRSRGWTAAWRSSKRRSTSSKSSSSTKMWRSTAAASSSAKPTSARHRPNDVLCSSGGSSLSSRSRRHGPQRLRPNERTSNINRYLKLS